MKLLTEVPKNDAIMIRIARTLYEGKLRCDVREYLKGRPPRSGIALTPWVLPAVVRTLAREEKSLIQMGLIELDDYRSLGLIPPCDLEDDS